MTLTEHAKHFNTITDLEVINETVINGNIECIDMVLNDRGIYDTLSDRQFRTLADRIDSKEFNTYKLNHRIIADLDPVGITVTLTHLVNETVNVDTELNETVTRIQNALKEITKA